MANERLNIPQTLKVGFQNRSDTYSGKLAYVTYINKKNEIAKQTSWDGWRSKDIDVETYENKPIEGFVLNRRAGGYKSGWNFRQTYCRVYDPRGFEVEISMENLLYILQECTSTKGKGLEGTFVYAWEGPTLILLPAESEDYKASTELQNKQEKITIKDLKVGASYKGKEKDYLIYIGKMEWFLWDTKDDKSDRRSYCSDYNIWQEVRRILMPTFVDIKTREFVGYKNMAMLDYLIEENVIAPDEVETYIDNYKTTRAYRTQFVDKLTIDHKLDGWEAFKKKTHNGWGDTFSLYYQRPGSDYIDVVYAHKKMSYQGMTEYEYMNANTNYKMTMEERERVRNVFKTNATITYTYEKYGTITFVNGKLITDTVYRGYNSVRETYKFTENDWNYMADGGYGSDNVAFTSKDGGNLIKKWKEYSLSNVSIKFNEEAPLPDNEK